jgi:hypothetical protein
MIPVMPSLDHSSVVTSRARAQAEDGHGDAEEAQRGAMAIQGRAA